LQLISRLAMFIRDIPDCSPTRSYVPLPDRTV
jgi:hypothetical protein